MTQPTACVICSRRQPRTGMVCDPDRDRLGRVLGEIVELYALLPGQMMPGQATGPRVSGSREAPLPLRVDPLDLTMPARAGGVSDGLGDQVGYLSVAAVLDSWVRDWREVRAMGETLPAPTVVTLAGWLGVRLDWACDHHPAIDEFSQELSGLVRTLASVARTDHGRGVKVGKCPAVLRDDTRCAATLRVDPFVDQIQCGHCGTRWNRRKGEWLSLRAAQLGTGDAA